MSSATLSPPVTTQSERAVLLDPLSRAGVIGGTAPAAPILVATDGSSSAAAAVDFAAALAARNGGVVDALVVELPFPAPVSGVHFDESELRDAIPPRTRLSRVRDQLVHALAGTRWGLHVEFGRIGPTIARAAGAVGARLIALGLSRDHRGRRPLGDVIAARVLRHAQVPVLAVVPGRDGLPHTAVVAVDFSPSSIRAAAAARDLLEPPATLWLLHVLAPFDQPVSDVEGWSAVYEAGVSIELEKLGEQLAADGLRVETRLENGPVARALLRVAREVGADLVACGSHGGSTFTRLVLGSVAAEVLREANCSVLVAPPHDVHATVEELQ
jgi:nucleotide-binding universal stress UspA family protein